MEKVSTKKKIIVAVLLVVLLVAAGILLLKMELGTMQKKEQAQCQLKLDAVAEVYHSTEAMREASRATFEDHLQKNVRFMTAILAEEVTEGGYTGPVLFEDGAVVEVRDGKAVWPEGIAEGFPELRAEDVTAGTRFVAEVPAAGDDAEAAGRKMIFLSGKIAENYYYVDWTEEREVLEDESAWLENEGFLKAAEEVFGGNLLLIAAGDPSLSLVSRTPSLPEVKSAAELGFTPEIIAEKRPAMDINGKSSLCTYAETEDGTATLIYIKPADNIIRRAWTHVGLGMAGCLIILGTMVVYIFSVRNYVLKNKKLSRAQISRYKPKNFRRTIIMAGITGAIIIFACTAIYQTMDALHEESIIGARSLNSLFEYLQTNTMKRIAYDKEGEAEWAVYQGERMADVITRHPEAGSREKLQEYCDILGYDFIMLFDAEGKETATNSNYTGFTMDAGLGENSADFRRLLKGIPSIVHEASADPLTGLTRQMIGVTMPAASGSGEASHGALVMAIVPKDVKEITRIANHQLSFLKSDDRLCLFANPENGKILYASDENLAGMTVTECGMPEKSLQSGYTDFATVNGTNSYVTMVKQPEVDFFYIISSNSLFSNTLPAACGILISYLLVFVIVIWVCLAGYNDEAYSKWIDAKKDQTENDGQGTGEQRDWESSSKSISELLMSTNKSKDQWMEKTPETHAGALLKLDILLLLVVPSLFFLGGTDGTFGGASLFQYIMTGDWIRGLNLFAVCGILTVVSGGILILLICNVVLSLIAGFTGRGGETICRLLYSLARYVTVLTILYYVFEYIGISMSTYIASVSMISLAISIGSRDMVSDILAGVLILFEGQFQAGDIVEIDGCRGRVLEIGVRSTKLLCQGNDIRYISNSGIRSVVNKAKQVSTFTTELAIVTGEPLEKVEELFKRELPAISRKNRMIKSELTVAGISKVIGGGKPDRDRTIALRIKCECRERDYEEVRDYVNRQIYLLCERENLELR